MTVVATVNAGKLTGEGRGVISELEWRSTTSLESAPYARKFTTRSKRGKFGKRRHEECEIISPIVARKTLSYLNPLRI